MMSYEDNRNCGTCAPREVRYDIKIVTRDGKQHKL